jgi:glycerate-2-kinase
MRNLTAAALRIYLNTLEQISVPRLLGNKVHRDGMCLVIEQERVDLDQFEEVVLIGFGKASIQMALSVKSLLADQSTRGVLVTDRRPKLLLPDSLRVVVGGHPVPNAGSLEGARLILEAVGSCTDRSLLIFLVSGGGSSLVEMPISESIALGDLQWMHRRLVESGATIQEINTVRKFLSRTKGGRLGYLARNVRTVGLYLSDVNTGDLKTIASNPVLFERLSRDRLRDVLDRYGIARDLAPKVKRALDASPNQEEWHFARGLTTVLLGDNSTALDAAALTARTLGFIVQTCDDLTEEPYESIAREMIKRLMLLKEEHPGEMVCLISGGEALCAVRGRGVGGRNQEFVLYSAASLRQSGLESAVVFSAGTDGVDGNSTAAGAAFASEAAERALQRGIDSSVFLNNSDSHSFFSEAGGLVVTGPTGNNVRDLRMMLAC